ncbi:DUF4231 domain-containing protein [uncultured Streptococcus sp.]|uniref:DUF4231 domain-containing protein n=1 Tax=uncultured Streptococcus sp. TaxID=83427 RepID=UPI002596E7DB|nr:DUF4231 domain-containing protein [uncultured Streptococcus sp.]
MDDYTEMTIETYLTERLTKEIAAYEKKSHFHRAWFIVFKVIQIIVLALVPILASLPIPCFKLLAVIVSCLVLVLEALLAVSNHKDKWRIYQATSKELASEKFTFETTSSIYKEKSTEDRFALLVDRRENIIKNKE